MDDGQLVEKKVLGGGIKDMRVEIYLGIEINHFPYLNSEQRVENPL